MVAPLTASSSACFWAANRRSLWRNASCIRFSSSILSTATAYRDLRPRRIALLGKYKYPHGKVHMDIGVGVLDRNQIARGLEWRLMPRICASRSTCSSMIRSWSTDDQTEVPDRRRLARYCPSTELGLELINS